MPFATFRVLFTCYLPSQWSTLQSGPLARDFHLSSALFPHFPPSQWSTLQSRPLARSFHLGFGPFPQFPTQLVVHSPKWSTSSRLSPRFRPFPPVSHPASGPLQRVDHWLRDSALYVTFPPYQKAPVLRTGATPPMPSRLLALGGI